MTEKLFTGTFNKNQNKNKTKQALQPQKMVGGLKFWIKEVEVLYYLCSQNKGTVTYFYIEDKYLVILTHKLHDHSDSKSLLFLKWAICFKHVQTNYIVCANKNIKMKSFKSSENIQKKEGGPDRSVSDNQSSSVTVLSSSVAVLS